MTTAIAVEKHEPARTTGTMKAHVFHGPNQIAVEAVPIPTPGIGEAVIRVTLTTICGTDVHILKGEYPVKTGLIIGHEAVGDIHELGAGVSGYEVGDRVLVGAITPCGQCTSCLRGNWSQCGGVPIGGWKFGNTIHGAQAEYLLVPSAQANMARIPAELTDEQVILLADIASTGFSAAESGEVQLGDSVAVLAQGPIGMCATAGTKLKGASLIIASESNPVRKQVALKMDADVVLDPKSTDVVADIRWTMGEHRKLSLKRIVVPVDFSGTSYGALSYARQLARCFSAKILLVHVIDMMRSVGGIGQPELNLPQQVDIAEYELQKIAAGLSEDGIRYATIVRNGEIRATVLDLIEEREAELLVIGTRGKGNTDGKELGSVAETLLRAMPCPVLTVGKYVRMDACERTHTRRVLFTTDFSEISGAALSYTESLPSSRHW